MTKRRAVWAAVVATRDDGMPRVDYWHDWFAINAVLTEQNEGRQIEISFTKEQLRKLLPTIELFCSEEAKP